MYVMYEKLDSLLLNLIFIGMQRQADQITHDEFEDKRNKIYKNIMKYYKKDKDNQSDTE